MFVVTWLVAEAVVISTQLLVPADFADRHRVLFEMFEPHPEWGFHTRPNLRKFRIRWRETGVEASYSTDEFGFRNVGRDYDAAPIAFIGDSFTFGVWVAEEETFAGRLEQQLATPILNLGQQSFYIEQYALALDWFLENHQPDVIVVSIFANDLTPEMTSDDFAHFYERFGWNTYKSLSWRQRSITSHLGARLNTWRHPPVPPQEAVSGVGPLGLTLFRIAGAHPEYVSGDQFTHTEQVLAVIVERATSQGVQTVVAFLPSKESTYHRDYAQLFGGDYLDNEGVGFARLATVAETAGAIAVDLTPTFRAHADEPLYFEVDAHFNATGHALVTAALRPILETALAEESRQ